MVKEPPTPGKCYFPCVPHCRGKEIRPHFGAHWALNSFTLNDFLGLRGAKINLNVSDLFAFLLLVSIGTSAIKDMASNIERRWRTLVANSDGSKPSEPAAPDGKSPYSILANHWNNPATVDPKAKKRKLNDLSTTKSTQPTKKAAVATPPSSAKPTVKKEVKTVVTAVKDAKSDSSFFSAPKPKPKLPNFKKAPAPPAAPVKTERDPHIAQPSAFDPFQEALKSMGKARRGSPATVAPSNAANSLPTASVAVQSSKKKKSVSWAPEGKLELIRLIERAIYDDDPVDVSYFPPQLLRFVVLYINSVLCLLVTGSAYSAQLTRSGSGCRGCPARPPVRRTHRLVRATS